MILSFLSLFLKTSPGMYFKLHWNKKCLTEMSDFYDKYLQLIEEGHQAYEHPDLLLFSVIELASSTCYNCILYQQPVPLEEYMPYLHKSIDGILSSYQKDSSDTSAD